mmetsp:Transcript_32065/g.69422  ORF Transcript_32065/g.69422 Transcript_32065/m.69422 type:complete len:256 (-) Transcript_32065:519-1286(-)
MERGDAYAQYLVGHYHRRSRYGKIGKCTRQSKSQRRNQKRLPTAGDAPRSPLCEGEDAVIVRKAEEGTTEKAQHALVPADTTQSTLNPRPVDMSSVTTEEAGARIGNGKLRNSQDRGSSGEQIRRHGNAEEVVERSCELPLHLMLSELIAKDEVKGVVHPTESLPISEQLHYQGGRRQDRHSGYEAISGDDVMETREEEAEGAVQDLALDVGAVAILELLGVLGGCADFGGRGGRGVIVVALGLAAARFVDTAAG